jgi:hypothetical protein
MTETTHTLPSKAISVVIVLTLFILRGARNVLDAKLEGTGRSAAESKPLFRRHYP